MGEIRFVGTGETRGCPYPVCKKDAYFTSSEDMSFCKLYLLHYLLVFFWPLNVCTLLSHCMLMDSSTVKIMLYESICHLRGVEFILSLLCYFFFVSKECKP